jgi:acetyl-CoA synthetase
MASASVTNNIFNLLAIEEEYPAPKTRSGKILRRFLKAKELGLDAGDFSTMEG